MSGETPITLVGNLTADPELRFTQSGAAVANFTVASTPRTFDRASGEWKDGETLWMRCSIWRDAAEHVSESLKRGHRVIVTGKLKSRTYTTNDDQQRTVIEMEVDEVGPSLRWANVKVAKADRTNGNSASTPTGSSTAAEDPWGTTAPAGARSGGFAEEPPF